MASNDWKAELKRRIEDIKEKKKQETKKSSAAAAKPTIKQEVQKSIAQAQKKKAEEANATVPPKQEEQRAATPEREKPQPEAWPKTRHNMKRQMEEEQASPPANRRAPAEPATPPQQEEEQLFQVDTSAPKTRRNNDDSIEEERIRRALANASSKQARRRKARGEEQTLFSMDPEAKPDPKPAEKRQRINVSDLSFVEETEEEPVPEPTLEESLESIDSILDSYIPVSPLGSEEDEEPLVRPAPGIGNDDFVEEDSDFQPQRPTMGKTIVVDKTHQYRNLLRIGAGLIDTIFLLSIEAMMIWVASLILKSTPLTIFFESLIPFAGLFLVLHFIYYMLFMSVTGQTPGKSLFQLRVVNKQGNCMGFGRGFLRWILQILSLAPAALGFLMMFASAKGNTIYDMILGTRLVRKEQDSE